MSKLTHMFLIVVMSAGAFACQGKGGGTTGGGDTNYPGTIPGLKTVYFDFDQALIRNDQAAILQNNADFLRSNKGNVVIEGHCDERGTNEYNIALGDRRSRATKSYLTNLGVDESRLNTLSYGEERPVATCHDESCWWQNRRADFTR